MGLLELRSEIDRIDREIIALLRKRFEMAREIVTLKRETGVDIEDNAREAEIIENCKDESRGDIDEAFVDRLMRMIIEESKKIQEKMK